MLSLYENTGSRGSAPRQCARASASYGVVAARLLREMKDLRNEIVHEYLPAGLAEPLSRGEGCSRAWPLIGGARR